MVGGISEDKKEAIIDTLDSKKKEVNFIPQRKDKEIKEEDYTHIPVLKKEIRNPTPLRENILLVMVNDKPHEHGIQAGDIWIELGRPYKTLHKVRKACDALNKQEFLIKSDFENIIIGEERPLYRINPNCVQIKEIDETEEIPQETIKQTPPTKDEVMADNASERMSSIESTNRQILDTLQNNNHIMPIIEEMHIIKNKLNTGLNNVNFRIDVQQLKDTRYQSNEGLKLFFDGRFSALDEQLELNMHPIGKQLSMKDLEEEIRTLEKINLNHARLPELYRELILIYVNIYVTYHGRDKLSNGLIGEIWKRLISPQRKRDREHEQANQEAISRMKNAKDDPVDEVEE